MSCACEREVRKMRADNQPGSGKQRTQGATRPSSETTPGCR
jgi:hypothetical protein